MDSSLSRSAAIQHAARLNSEGVLLMNEGADLESARALTEALTVMQSQLVQQQCPSPPSDSSSSSSPVIEFSEKAIELRKPSDNGSSLLFIFNRGIYFRVPPTSTSMDKLNHPQEEQQPSSQHAHIYCVAIIFNLALLYHKRALMNNNDNCFRKADDLYRKITLILGYPNSFDCGSSSLPSDSPATIIMIAAINNMSQIRYEKGHYDLAEDSIKALSQILQISSPSIATSIPIQGQGSSSSSPPCDDSSALSMDFWNQIVLNVLLLKQPTLAAAA